MRYLTAIAWNAVSQFGQSGTTLVSTVILARLLTPDDFGLIGIVAVFMAFSQMLVDSEMGGSLLRKAEISIVDYNTLFYYNLTVGIILYLIFYFAAPAISLYYGRTELTGIIRVIGITVIIHSLKVVQLIMLLRAFEFKRLAVINTVSGALALIIAIILAKTGSGYMSLVWQQVSLAILSLLFMEMHNRFIPRLSFSKRSFRYQFFFGINLLGAKTLSTVASNISTNVVAKISTLQFTGYFSQAGRLTTFFTNFLDALMSHSIYPLMSRLTDIRMLTHTYHKILTYTATATGILTLVLCLAAPLIIRIILGPEWMPSVPVFRILALAILPGCIQSLCRNVMKTLGSTRGALHIESAVSIILLAALVIASYSGSIAVAVAVVSVQYAGCIIWIVYIEKILGRRLLASGNDINPEKNHY